MVCSKTIIVSLFWLKRSADTPYAVFPIRMLVQAMVIFRESLKEWTPVRRDGTANEHGMGL